MTPPKTRLDVDALAGTASVDREPRGFQPFQQAKRRVTVND